MESETEKTERKTIPVKIEKEKSSFWELVRFALIAIAVVLPVRFFIAQPFVVSGSSMVPTFENGDYLIVDEISYTLGTPKRGDVVIFRYPKDPSKFFIKRIIGLPDETVSIKGNIVTIVNKENPDGFELLEPFIKNTANNNTSVKLDDDEYFVMGDNRSGSSDSRVWGPVKKNLLVGRALLRLLPVNKIGVMPGQLE